MQQRATVFSQLLAFHKIHWFSFLSYVNMLLFRRPTKGKCLNKKRQRASHLQNSSYSAHRKQPKKEKNISILAEISKPEIKTLLEIWFWILLYCPLLNEMTKKVSFLPCFSIYLSENCVIFQTVLHIAVAPPGRELQTRRWHNQTQIVLWNKKSKTYIRI